MGGFKHFSEEEDKIIAAAFADGPVPIGKIRYLFSKAGYARGKQSIRARCTTLGFRGKKSSQEDGDNHIGTFSSVEEQDHCFCIAMKAALESGLETDGGNPKFGIFKDLRPIGTARFFPESTRSLTGSQALSCSNAYVPSR